MIRHDGTNEVQRKRGWFRRLRLRRADGGIYLDRWGIAHEHIGRVLLHCMGAPDPGIDLHDHPWWFCSIVLWGGYTEQRADTRDAVSRAVGVEMLNEMDRGYLTHPRGDIVRRSRGSIRTMRLDECHTISDLHQRTSWTLVIGGPRRRGWGFYTPDGYIDEATYDETVRAGRRDLWSDENVAARPW